MIFLELHEYTTNTLNKLHLNQLLKKSQPNKRFNFGEIIIIIWNHLS